MTFCQPYQATQDQHRPCGATGCINRVACGASQTVPLDVCSQVWSRLLWPSVWPTVHTTWLPVSEGIVNPPTLSFTLPTHPLICGIRDISGSVQDMSQNQPVHNDSYFPTLFLLQILHGYY